MSTPAYWDAFNNAMAVPNPISTFVAARNRRDVGNALSTGDYSAGAQAAYGAGMIDEGLQIDRLGGQREDDARQREARDAAAARQAEEDRRAEDTRRRTSVLSSLQGLRYAAPTARAARLEDLKAQLVEMGANAAQVDLLAVDGLDDAELDSLIAEYGGDPQEFNYRQSQIAANTAAANRRERVVVNGQVIERDPETGRWNVVATAPRQAPVAGPRRIPNSAYTPGTSGGIGGGAPAGTRSGGSGAEPAW